MWTASVGIAKTQKGTMLIPAEPDSHRPCEAEGCFAGEPCVKGQRDRRDHGTFELQSFGRVLDVVEVLRLLALKGRQITDGGKQRVAPGHGKLITPPPSADGAREGEGGGCGMGPGVTLRSPPSVLCRPFRAKSIIPSVGVAFATSGSARFAELDARNAR